MHIRRVGTHCAWAALFVLAGCSRNVSEPEEDPVPAQAVGLAESAPSAAKARFTPPVPSDSPLKPLPPEAHEPKTLPPAVEKESFTVIGAPGELLQTNLFKFKLLETSACHRQQATPEKPHSGRVVIAAHVEIEAKTMMRVMPREVVLRSGGFLYYADAKLAAKAPTCKKPLLETLYLKPGKATRGWVLFDVPLPEPPNLEVSFGPTRWGGAGRVRALLSGCVSCTQ